MLSGVDEGPEEKKETKKRKGVLKTDVDPEAKQKKFAFYCFFFSDMRTIEIGIEPKLKVFLNLKMK